MSSLKEPLIEGKDQTDLERQDSQQSSESFKQYYSVAAVK
jgi:hypothetical protein